MTEVTKTIRNKKVQEAMIAMIRAVTTKASGKDTGLYGTNGEVIGV